jgi:hypothetical protein
MKTEFHPFTDEELENRKWPLPPSVIPNYMGIDLGSVEGMSWTRQEDGQLVRLTIHFNPTSLRIESPYKDKCVGVYGKLRQQKNQSVF